MLNLKPFENLESYWTFELNADEDIIIIEHLIKNLKNIMVE